ncbi:macrosialin [Ochotona curzoniae]|uniref:macrosialin n=1 Tax=Ochotona curzoniae TaxID=130825 RepID=UPI001B3458AF|nr:macrosialin [Ochotona curzoniae]
MRLPVLFVVLLALQAAQGTGEAWPHKKSATLLPSFTVTPTATESTTTSGTTSHWTTKSPNTTTPGTTSHRPTTAIPTTGHGNVTAHPTTSNTTTTTTSALPTSHLPPGPPPPSPSPSPGSREAIGTYTWKNGSQPCVQLQAGIQIRILYQTRSGGQAWGISVLNPNKTKPLGSCEDPHSRLLLSFPSGQLSLGFTQDPKQNQSTVYLSYMAVEYNVTFPQAAQWTFSAWNSSLQDLQAPLGRSFSCSNASIAVSPTLHLDLLSLRVQAAQLSPTGIFGPSFSCPTDQPSILLPLIIGLILLGLLILVLVAFCVTRRRPSAYQAL